MIPQNLNRRTNVAMEHNVWLCATPFNITLLKTKIMQNFIFNLEDFKACALTISLNLEQMIIDNTNVDLAQKSSFCQTPVISRFSIPETLELIKEQTGLKLELCDYFTGIKEHNGRKYFNIILRQRTSESKEYDTLKRFADKYKMISVEPNGLNRVAVFQNGL